MAEENNDNQPATPPELTPEYIAEATSDAEKFDKLPIEEQERIASAFTEGKVTDEEVEAAREKLANPPPEKTAEEIAAEHAAAAAAAGGGEKTETEESEEEPVKSEAEILAEAREQRLKIYDEKRAELRKIIDKPEPERLTDAHDEWLTERNKALLELDELRENHLRQTDREFIDANRATAEKTQGSRAEAAVEKAISASPVFAGKMKLEGGIAAAEKLYQPWLDRVVKANGGDPSKPEDINAAYRRFLSDKTFAAAPDLQTPTNIHQILIALTARDLVKQGFTGRGALTEAAERLGVGKAWEEEHVQGRVNAATGVQTDLVKKALAAKPGEVRTAPAGAPGPSQIQSDTLPYDKESAEAFLTKLMDEEEAASKLTGKLPKRTEKQELYANKALEILERDKG